ncbi:AvrBs1/Avra family type III secretion system effector [Paraburkholderia humisilvae]|uniref:Uncharacterized protein n=1 Tax=Paraburkholderia humisilvae TaxID=627669 RepID=A0A6J5F7C3_9BURK|nr:AvrBs1/Avra family type III secretion system effector [Paraburkholderia humisilvae]CAB3773502.1 hypothetical protein LMG29542_07264 [Paraburkholderia humisilvae]
MSCHILQKSLFGLSQFDQGKAAMTEVTLAPNSSKRSAQPQGSSSSTSTGTTLSSGRTVSSLAPRLRQLLQCVQEKKIQVQHIARVYEQARKAQSNGKDIYPIVSAVTAPFSEDAIVEKKFCAGEPMAIRTLRFSSDDEAVCHFGGSGKTPARREVDTLANNIFGRRIVMTPSSVIACDAKVNTISLMEKPHRPKWKGLPSVIFFVPNPLAGSVSSTVERRNGFGDVHSFASSQAFDAEYEQAANWLSHAQRLDMLEKKAKVYMKEEPDRYAHEFCHSLMELAQHMRRLQMSRPGQPLRHNEYCTKLELWDARALEVGKNGAVAVATLVEFNLEMTAMALAMEREGIAGSQLTDFLKRQFSWSYTNEIHDLQTTLRNLECISSKTRENVLHDICSQLRAGISLCVYEHQEAGSQLRALSLTDFPPEDVMEGLRLFLSSRLLHL